MLDALYLYFVVTAILDFFILFVIQETNTTMDKLLNPITIYKTTNVNVLGCIALTLLYHLVFIWYAPFYWIYKLCTVGRK